RHTRFSRDWSSDVCSSDLVNYRIAEELGLQNRKIFMPKKNILKQLAVYVPPEYSEQVRQAVFKAGAGNIGFYDECSFSVPGSGKIGRASCRERVELDG